MPLKEQNDNNIVRIRYFGNLGLGRWQILRELGLTVHQINAKGCKAMLEVYSSVTDPQIIRELTIENGCIYKGWIFGNEYLKLLQSADIAVHVESFDRNMTRRTWASISTKIADYLGAGKCILAVGPKGLASMDHIKNVSCVVDDLDVLQERLDGLVSSPLQRENYQEKARELAVKDHNIEKIKLEVRRLLEIAAK